MKCWVYVDSENRVMASNENDMSGNTGWYETKYPVPDTLVDMRGIPLYKWDGVICVNRSADEIEGDVQHEPVRQQPESERIAALEDQHAAWEAAYQRGVQSA